MTITQRSLIGSIWVRIYLANMSTPILHDTRQRLQWVLTRMRDFYNKGESDTNDKVRGRTLLHGGQDGTRVWPVEQQCRGHDEGRFGCQWQWKRTQSGRDEGSQTSSDV